jgi:hypothetical protein
MTTIPALTQVKIALVDPAGTLLSAATGDIVTYSDLYAHNGEDVQATIRHAAGILEGYFWQQVTSVSSGGESVAWATGRAQFYGAIAQGKGGGATGRTIRGLYVKGATPPMFTRGSLGTDPSLDEGATDAST